jgi:hypothetical protein
MSRAAGYFMIVLCCLALAGCFKSDVALIGPSNAAWPFKRASVSLHGADESRTYNLEQGASSYAFAGLPEEENAMGRGTILFYKVKDDLFIMQWQYGAGSNYDLFVIRMDGDQFAMDTCSAYRDETLSQLGMKRGLGDCPVENLEQLVRLAQMPPDEQGKKFMSGEVLHSEK